MQIDTTARRKLAELLRHLVSGVISNDEFEDRLAWSRDEAVVAIYEQAWLLYDDLHEHRLTGKWRVPDEARFVIARWILFLHSELPYEWPGWRLTGPRTGGRCLRGLLTFGRSVRKERVKFEASGDYDVWPFFQREDFDHAQTEPVLLGGAA
jgi:hypothetical protein